MLPPCLVTGLRRPPRSAAAAPQPHGGFGLSSSCRLWKRPRRARRYGTSAAHLVKMV